MRKRFPAICKRLESLVCIPASRIPVALAILPLLAVASAAQTPSSSLRNVIVDASSVIGTIKSLTGYNGSPIGGTRPPGAPQNPSPAQSGNQPPQNPEGVAQLLREVGVTTTRTQSVNTVSWVNVNPSVIFPDKNGDPIKESSYNFGPTDAILTGMLAQGQEPYIRVGDGRGGAVPEAFDKYAQIIRHIVLHYNKGWNKGYRLGIRFWEFWNEPDLNFPGRAQYWAGNSQQYFELYSKVAPAIKAADPNALVGGPTTGGNGPDYHKPFLKYLRDHHLPLDLYTYHWYAEGSNDPYDYVRLTDQIRSELNGFGFQKTSIFITEWGYDLYNKTTGAQRPVFVSASLGYMQDTLLDQSYYHSAGAGPLYTVDGITPTGRAFQAHASLQATPQRLKATGGDTIGFHVLAGLATASSSDTPNEIRIIVTNYVIPNENRGPHDNGRGMPSAAPYKGDDILVYPDCACTFWTLPRRNPTYANNDGYDLTVNHLPVWTAQGYTVNRYRLDNIHNMTLVDSTEQKGSTLHLSAKLPAPSVELIVIRADSAGSPTLEGIWSNKPFARPH